MSSTGGEQIPDRRERPVLKRLRYRPPSLERLGDLRSLTLGGSPGIPDSGIGMPEQPQP